MKMKEINYCGVKSGKTRQLVIELQQENERLYNIINELEKELNRGYRDLFPHELVPGRELITNIQITSTKTIYVYVKRKRCAMNGNFEKYNNKNITHSAVCYAWFVWQKTGKEILLLNGLIEVKNGKNKIKTKKL